MKQPIDYESPDWTAEEMRQDAPFHFGSEPYSEAMRRMRERHEREYRILKVKMWATLIVCAGIGLTLILL